MLEKLDKKHNISKKLVNKIKNEETASTPKLIRSPSPAEMSNHNKLKKPYVVLEPKRWMLYKKAIPETIRPKWRNKIISSWGITRHKIIHKNKKINKLDTSITKFAINSILIW